MPMDSKSSRMLRTRILSAEALIFCQGMQHKKKEETSLRMVLYRFTSFETPGMKVEMNYRMSNWRIRRTLPRSMGIAIWYSNSNSIPIASNSMVTPLALNINETVKGTTKMPSRLVPTESKRAQPKLPPH